jgi:DNA-binding transcriptional regulator YiaG
MIRAYDKILLASACDSLGRMIDYSVHSLRMDASSILDLFIASGTAALFGRGDIRLTAGMSGIELTYEVLERSGLTYERIPPRHTMSLSNEYWAGYALAHAQWESGLSFDEITGRLSIRDLIADAGRERLALLESLPLDISDEDKAAELRRFGESFAAKTAGLITNACTAAASMGDTALKRMRQLTGLSQSGLASASGVPVRTIQQYEQRQKDINKAGYIQLVSLASALNCEPASLLEIL